MSLEDEVGPCLQALKDANVIRDFSWGLDIKSTGNHASVFIFVDEEMFLGDGKLKIIDSISDLRSSVDGIEGIDVFHVITLKKTTVSHFGWVSAGG